MGTRQCLFDRGSANRWLLVAAARRRLKFVLRSHEGRDAVFRENDLEQTWSPLAGFGVEHLCRSVGYFAFGVRLSGLFQGEVLLQFSNEVTSQFVDAGQDQDGHCWKADDPLNTVRDVD